MNTLFLRLEGPLQAWGLRARWIERDTADAPTKSGVIGLLGCALGYRRDDTRLRDLSDQLRMAVRVDRAGTLLRDYQTTGGGRFGDAVHRGGTRFHSDPYVGGVLSAEVDRKGRIKVKINATTKEPETDTSERYYLADASFLVALQGPVDRIAQAAEALQHPVWPCYLGRKACVPAQPIFIGYGDHPDLAAALASQELAERCDPFPLRTLYEVGPGQGNRQNDNLGTPARRIFRPRYIREEWWMRDTEASSLNTLEG